MFLTLIERADSPDDEEQGSGDGQDKLGLPICTFETFLDQLEQVRKMGAH